MRFTITITITITIALSLACASSSAQPLVAHHIPQAPPTTTGVPDLPMGDRTAR